MYHEEELRFQEELQNVEIEAKRTMNDLENTKMKKMIGAIGQQTLVELAKAGPETQAKLLQGLGLKGFMIVDGKNPVNLFNTANGLLGNFVGKAA